MLAVLSTATVAVAGVPSQAAGAGRIVYDKGGHIWMMHDDGSAKTDLTPGWTGFAFDPSLSKDGTKVVFIWQNSAAVPASAEVYSIPATPTSQSSGSRLTFNNVSDLDPRWSPDGAKIAFARDVPVPPLDPENYEIFTMNANGTSATRLTHDSQGDVDLVPAWSPDGSHIAFVSSRAHLGCDDGGVVFISLDHVFVMTSTGGSPADVTNRTGLSASNPAWSPDGTRIAFDGDQWTLGPADGNGPTCVSDTGDHIYVMAAAGSTNPAAVHTGDDPAWSPDGGRLAYVDGIAQAMSTMDASGASVASLSENGRFPDWGVAPAVDSTSPLPAVVTATPFWTMTGTPTVAWTANDNPGGSGVASYNVRVHRATTGATFGAFTRLRTATTATSAPGTLLPGQTGCYSVQARDKAGNLAAWSADRALACSSMPLDDRALTASTGWLARTGAAYYRGTYLQTTTLGKSLTKASVAGKRFSVVATTCPTCGKVRVSVGSTVLGTLNLASPTTQKRRVLALPLQAALRSGTLRIKVLTSGKLVQIDGAGLSRM